VIADEPSVRGVESNPQRLAELRARIAADPRLKEAKEALAAAEKAIAEKLAHEPLVAQARQAEQAAREAVGKAEQSAAEADPQVQEQRRALAAARARDGELDLQRRFEEMKAEHLRNEARANPELRDLWNRANLHGHHHELLKADPRLDAARKKLEEANAALNKKVRELPEHKASEDARKEFEEAVATSQAMKDVEAARRAIDERTAKDERVAAQVEKAKAAGEAQKAHRETIADIERKIREASGRAAAKDAQVTEAMKAVAAAQSHMAQTIKERIAGEYKAREAARSSLQQKFEAVVAEIPEAKELEKEMRSLEERLHMLRNRMGELRNPATP
jgi:colicin import membrane protein